MALWIVILAVVIVLYFMSMIWFLPKLFLKSKYSLNASHDRGIKRYTLDPDGYAIVYEPQLKIRKYVKQYIIAEREGQKWLKCKIAPEIFYLDFEIFLFDSSNRVFDVMQVKDLIQKDGYTQDVELPFDTAYIAIVLNQVDNDVLNKRKSVKVSRSRLVGFWIWSILICIAFAMLLKLCIANLMGGVFRQSIMLSLLGNLEIIAVALAIAVLYMLILTFAWKKNKK